MRPVVVLPAGSCTLDQLPAHMVGGMYIEAVRLAACLPLVAPAAGVDDIDELLAHADGILLSGPASNVHPSHFGEAVHNPELPLELGRDGLTLPLISRALVLGVPLLAIRRGFQEVNVALGGSLHQAEQEVPGKRNHRAHDDAPLELQYAQMHQVNVVPGGLA